MQAWKRRLAFVLAVGTGALGLTLSSAGAQTPPDSPTFPTFPTFPTIPDFPTIPSTSPPPTMPPPTFTIPTITAPPPTMPPSTSPPSSVPDDTIDNFFDRIQEVLEEGADDFEEFSEAVNELIAELFG